MHLDTKWLGLELKNPFVPSASPLSRSLDASKQLEDAGAGAIVMYSLFEEAVRAEEDLNVQIAGSGNVEYAGNAEVVSRISGSGDLERR